MKNKCWVDEESFSQTFLSIKAVENVHFGQRIGTESAWLLSDQLEYIVFSSNKLRIVWGIKGQIEHWYQSKAKNEPSNKPCIALAYPMMDNCFNWYYTTIFTTLLYVYGCKQTKTPSLWVDNRTTSWQAIQILCSSSTTVNQSKLIFSERQIYKNWGTPISLLPPVSFYPSHGTEREGGWGRRDKQKRG